MVYIKKSKPTPEIVAGLNKEKAKKSGTYLIESVINKVKEDFFNKCYLCESKKPANINIEHFIPHENNKELKFDWNNLYWSCGHCNNIKSNRYNSKKPNSEILDCTKKKDEVETSLVYYVDPFPKSEVKITPLRNGIKVQNTVQLLKEIYGGTTYLKTTEAVNLKDQLIKEIFDFTGLLHLYCNAHEEERKEDIKKLIKDRLSIKSDFAAFKRWIIRKNTFLSQEFGSFIK